jgi:ABC-type nitrate/sulfonate/bicarbonate transport systems, periplasmic components
MARRSRVVSFGKITGRLFPVLFFLPLFLLCGNAFAAEKKISVGYFPNVTHAHALVAQSMAADGEGWFESRLPEGVSLEWHSFNAGPSAMEALFSKSIDLTYVGPSPVLNAFVRSKGGVTVAAGAVRGGAALVVPEKSALSLPGDFRGMRIATPQLGNTQDVACRSWLTEAGLRITMTGGDAKVIPTPNPTILQLFATDGIDAAWTVEPWVSRLELELGGKVVYTEPVETSVTTVLAMGKTFSDANPALALAFVAAHGELTEWIKANPDEAKRRVREELTRQMRREFPAEVLERAWPRLLFENAIAAAEFARSLEAAQDAGFLKGEHDLTGLVGGE